MKEQLTLTSEQVKHDLQRLPTQEKSHVKLQNELNSHVFGQPQATEAVALKLMGVEAGINDTSKPLGVFLEIGATGVGKTELAKATAKVMIEDNYAERLKILNMGEFQEGHTISRILGAPPSYVGYGDGLAIPSTWLHAGRSVIVFDEIEKAHPKLHRFLLSVCDEGKAVVREERGGETELNFNQSIIFMTSNAGSEELNRKGASKVGFGQVESPEEHKQQAIEALGRIFPPEFLGRVEIVTFNKLERQDFSNIFHKVIEERNSSLRERMKALAPNFAVTKEFEEYVLSKLDLRYGARGIKSLIEKELFGPAAGVILASDVSGRPIVADREEDATYFYTEYAYNVVDIVEFNSNQK